MDTDRINFTATAPVKVGDIVEVGKLGTSLIAILFWFAIFISILVAKISGATFNEFLVFFNNDTEFLSLSTNLSFKIESLFIE